MKNIFFFDVESTSLHGTGFAVGAIVSNNNGEIIDRFELASLEGIGNVSDWVRDNVLPHLEGMPVVETDKQLRDAFFEFYMKHKDSCEIWSDCNFPVETNFLSAIVADDVEGRQWSMPYPLKDLSTLLDVNIDRVEMSGIKDLRKHQ
jgi:hypothetical protein